MTLCVGAFNSTSFPSSFKLHKKQTAQRDKNYSLMNLLPLSLVLPLKNTIFIMINENLCVSKPSADVADAQEETFIHNFLRFVSEIYDGIVLYRL